MAAYRIDPQIDVATTLPGTYYADGAAWLLKADYLQNKNAPKAEIRAAAQQFVEHADGEDDEQAKALPKVKAWLAKG